MRWNELSLEIPNPYKKELDEQKRIQKMFKVSYIPADTKGVTTIKTITVRAFYLDSAWSTK